MLRPVPARIALAYDCLFPISTGGGERLYRTIAEDLSGRGYEVDYLTARQWEGEDPRTPGFSLVPVSGPLRLYDAGGVRRTPAALAFAWGLWRTLLRRRRRYRAVFVSALPVLNVFAVRLALAGSGTRVVVDYLEVWGRAQWIAYAGRITGTIAWLLQRVAIALTPVATCHSQLTARRLRAEGLRGRLLVSPGLIDGELGIVPTPSAQEPPFVLYAGRHIPDKRVESLPAAVAVARTEIPDLRLVITGAGPSADAVRAAVADAGGTEWTRMPGFVDQEELDTLMSGAACLVNPSRREGYGLVVVEASAHGTPVVLVDDDDNAATELVDAGENGFVAASTDPADLAAEIVRAVRGGDALRAKTRSWYEQAIRTRTTTRTVDAIAEIFAGGDAPRTKGGRT